GLEVKLSMAYELTYRPLENPSSNFLFESALKQPELLEPEEGIGSFLVLQSVHALHETVYLPPQSLEQAWKANQEYIASKCLTQPPLACYPIYLMTVGENKDERLVYIGKTSSKSSRFSAGHAAISKLHHPKYDGLTKRVYLCCAVFINKARGTFPIEWIQPYEKAELLLKSFEAYLIYWTKPELNTQHIATEPDFDFSPIQAQNITGHNEFWHEDVL
ncbi:GIY-YIG nuclease family protein, partial [Vibrio parahaemolyticus]